MLQIHCDEAGNLEVISQRLVVATYHSSWLETESGSTHSNLLTLELMLSF